VPIIGLALKVHECPSLVSIITIPVGAVTSVPTLLQSDTVQNILPNARFGVWVTGVGEVWSVNEPSKVPGMPALPVGPVDHPVSGLLAFGLST